MDLCALFDEDDWRSGALGSFIQLTAEIAMEIETCFPGVHDFMLPI